MALTDDIYYSTYLPWTEGTGTQNGFTRNGADEENTRLYYTNPWGRREILWKATHDGLGNDGDGGWVQTYTQAIDNTKLYRFSVLFNRYVIDTKGRNYFGVYGFGGTAGMKNLHDETIDTNFYWWFTNDPPTTIDTNVWYLFMGHIYPYTETHTSAVKHPDSGIWKLDGTKQTPITRDCRTLSDTTTCSTRTYMFYCNTYTNNITYWARPRLDLCDGNQPTKNAILRDGRSFLFANLLVN